MIYLATIHAQHGPSLTGHKTLTQAIHAWEDAKVDPSTMEARLTNDRGDKIMSFERGPKWQHEVMACNPPKH